MRTLPFSKSYYNAIRFRGCNKSYSEESTARQCDQIINKHQWLNFTKRKKAFCSLYVARIICSSKEAIFSGHESGYCELQGIITILNECEFDTDVSVDYIYSSRSPQISTEFFLHTDPDFLIILIHDVHYNILPNIHCNRHNIWMACHSGASIHSSHAKLRGEKLSRIIYHLMISLSIW